MVEKLECPYCDKEIDTSKEYIKEKISFHKNKITVRKLKKAFHSECWNRRQMD